MMSSIAGPAEYNLPDLTTSKKGRLVSHTERFANASEDIQLGPGQYTVKFQCIHSSKLFLLISTRGTVIFQFSIV
ncbi:unnamed protein product [Protopolystoma xenopodis]|uniref:Uncharacterized protein n=1 Tax=Protopolystoma xenopodis TaxID=117903 RepID=A0A3S5BPP1_9PLAT|nr:unnamed protein product [Protopolystoma xenopodis]